jgi:hypothetical protein
MGEDDDHTGFLKPVKINSPSNKKIPVYKQSSPLKTVLVNPMSAYGAQLSRTPRIMRTNLSTITPIKGYLPTVSAERRPKKSIMRLNFG